MIHSPERLSFRIAIGGCISSGKSTLLNAICTKTYSDMQRKRTTMTPQIYCETDSQLDPVYLKEIRDENKDCNQAIYKKGSDLTLSDIKPNIYPIPRIPDFTTFHEQCYLDVYDLPGLNDSQTQGVFFEYIEQNHLDFDMIVYIVDVCSALNTTDEMNILTKFLDVIQLASDSDTINADCEKYNHKDAPPCATTSAYNYFVQTNYKKIRKEVAEETGSNDIQSKDVICACAAKWREMLPKEKTKFTKKFKQLMKKTKTIKEMRGQTEQETMSRHPPKIKSKEIKFLVVLNKIDEISMLDSNGDAELDEEGKELVDQAKEYINKEIRERNLEGQYLGTTYLCAADTYIYRLYNQNPNVKLDINHINRFGMNEYGKRSWSRFTLQQKEQKVQELMRDESGSNYYERMCACGFTNLKNIINASFSNEHQMNLLLHRLSRHIHKNIHYIEGPKEDIDNDIIKWRNILKLLCKIDNVYNVSSSKQPAWGKDNIIQQFVSSYFTPYITNVKDIYCSELDPTIWTEEVYDSQIDYKKILLSIQKMFTQFNYTSIIPALIEQVNSNINMYLEHMATSSNTFKQLFTNLDTLVKNKYKDITTLTKKILFGSSGKITTYEKGFREYKDIISIVDHTYLNLTTQEQMNTLKQFIKNHLDFIVTNDTINTLTIDDTIELAANGLQTCREINRSDLEQCEGHLRCALLQIRTLTYLYALRVCTKHNTLGVISQEFNDMVENLTMNAITKLHNNEVYLTSTQLSKRVKLPIVERMLTLHQQILQERTPEPIELEEDYSVFDSNQFERMTSITNRAATAAARVRLNGITPIQHSDVDATRSIRNNIMHNIAKKTPFKSPNYNNL